MKSFSERAAALWSEDSDVREKFGSADRLFDTLGCARFPNAVVAFGCAVETYADHHKCSNAQAVRTLARKQPELHRLYLDELGIQAQTAKAGPGPAAVAFENAVDLFVKQHDATRSAAIRGVIESQPILHDSFMAEINVS